MYVSYGSGLGAMGLNNPYRANYVFPRTYSARKQLPGTFGDDFDFVTDADMGKTVTPNIPDSSSSTSSGVLGILGNVLGQIGKGVGMRIAGPQPVAAVPATPSWLPLALVGGGLGLVTLLIVSRKK